MTHEEPLASVIAAWRRSDTREPVSGTMLTPVPPEGRSQHGVDLPVTPQTHTWHTWQRRLSQSPDAVGIWVPLEPRQDWRGVFHGQLEGETREEWRRGESVEKRIVWEVWQGTQRHQDSVYQRGVSGEEKWWKCWVNTKDKNLHYSNPSTLFHSAPNKCFWLCSLPCTTMINRKRSTVKLRWRWGSWGEKELMAKGWVKSKHVQERKER